MNKPKSTKFSLLVLTLLFILSQTVFALSSSMSGNYEIDIEGNRVLSAFNTQSENDILTVKERQLTFTAEISTPTQAPETSQATVLSIAADQAASTPQAVTLTVSEPAPKPEIKSVVKYVNAGTLNVRKEANSNSDLVATIKRGDKVTYYETIGEWASITTWNDQKGYILAKYLANKASDVEKVAEEKTATVSRGTSQKATAKPMSAEGQTLAEKIIAYSKTLLGVKYVWGGTSLKGLDCSGFTTIVYGEYGIYVPRSSGDYYGFGTKVSRSDLKAGDIVLWDIDGGAADVGHVGIYLGDGTFIHASSTKGKVVIADFATYGEKYMGARRVIK